MEPASIFVLQTSSIELAESHPSLRHLFVRSVGRIPPDPTHRAVRDVGMNEFILQFVADGKGWYRQDGRKHPLPVGTCLFIPPNAPHAYGADRDDPWFNYWAHFRGEDAHRYMNLLGLDAQNWLLNVRPDNLVRDCLEKLLTAYSGKHTEITMMQAANHLLQLFARLRALQAESTDPSLQLSGPIARSISYMEEHVEKRLSIDDFARIASLSRARYHQLFKAQTGETPIDYFIQLKARRASELLLSTNYTVENIALSLGFSNSFYFSRVFKKHFGQPPSRFRK